MLNIGYSKSNTSLFIGEALTITSTRIIVLRPLLNIKTHAQLFHLLLRACPTITVPSVWNSSHMVGVYMIILVIKLSSEAGKSTRWHKNN